MTTPASQALVRKSKLIMERWEERARQEVAATDGTSSLSLRDALPLHLEQLAAALASVGEKTVAEIAIHNSHEAEVGREHGRDRANTAGYSIDEVILEYRILRQVIIQVLEEEVRLSVAERDIITDLIEKGVTDAAAEFSETVRKMRDQFTVTLTHDLRGPVLAAMINAQIIMRSSEKPEVCVKTAKKIMANLERVNLMIETLLDAESIRAGQALVMKATECDPTDIASKVIEELVSSHGDRFVLSSDPALRTWWGCDLIQRALENLLGNAVKYGDFEAPITVSLQQVDSTVRITVHNEGSSISESEISSLFQIHRRSESAALSSVKGWGLGLTLVAGVVEAHGGTISVESSAEKGTSFVMVLPKDCRSKETAKKT